MSIIGKSLTTLGGGGMQPEIVVTSTAGSVLTVSENSVVKQTYTLGEGETQHTFKVPLNRIPNPNYHNLPSGFTEVEYLQSSGTQWIDTSLTGNLQISVSLDAQFLVHQSNTLIYGFWYSGKDYLIGTYNNSIFICCNNDTSDYHVQIPFDTSRHTLGWDASHYYFDGEIVSGKTPNLTLFNTAPIYLFNRGNYSAPHPSARIFEAVCTQDSNNVRDFIPCYNTAICTGYQGATAVADVPIGTAGMYDLVNNRFYINSGTGDFLYGDIVPRYLPYTVPATKGTMSNSINVYCDMVAQYPITVYADNFIYYEGNEYTSVTGGWTTSIMPVVTNYRKFFTNTNNELYVAHTGGYSTNMMLGGGTASKIDLTAYNAIHIDYSYYSAVGTNSPNGLYAPGLTAYFFSADGTSENPNTLCASSTSIINISETKTIDISAITGSFHIGFISYYAWASGNPARNIHISKIWLE